MQTETEEHATTDVESILNEIDLRWSPSNDLSFLLPLVDATPKVGEFGFVITDQNREYPTAAIVVKPGQGGIAPETGRLVPVTLERGELLLIGKHAGIATAVPSSKGYLRLLLARQFEVLARKEPGTFEVIIHDGDPAKMHEAGYTCDSCPQPKVDLGVLKDVAYGDPVPQDDGTTPLTDAPALDPSQEEVARAAIAAERERLARERQARESEQSAG